MADRFGPRGTVAVMIPLQNANMQPEYEAMRPAGINNQMYRFDLSKPDEVPAAVLRALPGARLCWPDTIVCGNSLEMRHWSRERQARYREEVSAAVPGIPVVTATDACEAALHTVGAKRIAVLSPMSEAYSESVQGYYSALGFEVPYATWLEVPRPEEIINVPLEAVSAAFARINHDDVDTFLHVGGALGIVDMLDELEARLGRPVISVNAATYWYALRRHGIDDPFSCGGQITRLPLPEHFHRKDAP